MGYVHDFLAVKSLVEEPVLNFERGPLQCEDVC